MKTGYDARGDFLPSQQLVDEIGRLNTNNHLLRGVLIHLLTLLDDAPNSVECLYAINGAKQALIETV